MDSAFYTGCDRHEEVDFLAFCSNDLDEWVIFFHKSWPGESIVAICEFYEVDDMWLGGLE